MTEDKIKESIQIAEELANELYTGKPSSSLLAKKWKEESPSLYEDLKKQENLTQEIAFHDSINIEEALRETNKLMTIPTRRFSIRTIGIAASFLLLAGAATLWLWNGNDKATTPAEWTSVIPGHSTTSILTKDNKKVTLENNHLTLKDGQLMCSTSDGKKNVAIELNPHNQLNRLSVPAGGEYELTLEDGTILKMNTASELLFPTHFKNKMRQVHLNGEAYFKVKKEQASPFLVQLGALNVMVTGTTFNIKAYEKDEEIHITLIEGSVNVRTGQQILAALTPGQMFIYNKASREYNIYEANTSAVTSWTDGKFIFYNETIGHIMRDLSRWYDVDIHVSDDIKNLRYSGMLSRKQPITEMLEALSLTNELDFKIHKNKQIDATEKKNK